MRNLGFCLKLKHVILFLLMTICLESPGYCEGKTRLILEDKILSYVSSPTDGDAEDFYKSFDEIESLPVQEAISICLSLSDYYLGSAGGELYLEKTTKIREEVLPYLIEKREMPLECKNSEIFPSK